MDKKSILALSFVFVSGAFLRLLNLQYFHALDTDEAIYAQIVFAMTRGQTLYRTVGFVHPPIYPALEYPFVMINPTLFTVRIFNIALGLAIIYVIFHLCKMIYTFKVALLASSIYALYPVAIYSNKLALIENTLTFFVTLAFFFFAMYVKQRNQKYLYLSGLFAGLSFMTKYTAALFIVALVLFAILRVFKRKFVPLLSFMASMTVFPVLVAILLMTSNVWPFFYVEAVGWQLIRFGMPLSEKFWFFGLIIASLSPLILVAILNFRRNFGDWRGEMMMSWFFVPLIILAFSGIVFLHYGFSLLPPLAILAALSIDRYVPSKIENPIFNRKRVTKIATALLTMILILVVVGRFANLTYGMQWFFIENVLGTERENRYAQAQTDVSSYIMNVTSANDKIWSTDASFGFLSQRLLVTPNSEYWKFQGFFQDVWGYGWSPQDYRGPIPGFPNGLFTIQNILEAWKAEKPKLLLVIRTSWVDYFIWNGIYNSDHKEAGLADYITSNYQIASKFYNNTIEVWIQNRPIESTLVRQCVKAPAGLFLEENTAMIWLKHSLTKTSAP